MKRSRDFLVAILVAGGDDVLAVGAEHRSMSLRAPDLTAAASALAASSGDVEGLLRTGLRRRQSQHAGERQAGAASANETERMMPGHRQILDRVGICPPAASQSR